MKRWNGWGEEAVGYPVPKAARQFLLSAVGPGQPGPDATLEQVLKTIPLSDLPAHSLIRQDPLDRLQHARGQSLPDWIALRSGRLGAFPDGVAYPASDDEVRSLIVYAHIHQAALIPYGGGTSVVGHINPLPKRGPVLTVDLRRFDTLVDFDRTSRLATLGAGLPGPAVEALLRSLGYTLGHFPQSWEYSTVGGWIATRSSGQQSYHYGRIENLFAGGHIETPRGPLDLPPLPASAAGPDLRQMILGSEGRLGIITRACMRVQPRPPVEGFYAAFFHNWTEGAVAVREIAQAGIRVSMLRLADADETETTLKLAGRVRLMEWAERGLATAGYGASPALLIYGVTGDPDSVNLARFEVEAIARAHGGLPVPFIIGEMWRKTRFLTPYLRNTLWELGYAIDTLETAVPWFAVEPTAAAIKGALRTTLEMGERVWVFAHLSHVYVDGASIYVTYVFPRSLDPDATLARWRSLKSAASRVIVGQGGTISHQHGVGIDHEPYLIAEKGAAGMLMLEGMRYAVDPDRLMNPGKLLE
ncbi:MAG: FAD-binding oxidoreductase [Anaerolineae bacterium]